MLKKKRKFSKVPDSLASVRF